MHQRTDQLPVVISAGSATIRSAQFAEMCINLVQVPKGTDFGPLLAGLPGDMCQCPHWGYVIEGRIHIRFADGKQETVKAGEVFFWPAGHTGWVDEDTSFLEVSPAEATQTLIAHLAAKVGASQAASA